MAESSTTVETESEVEEEPNGAAALLSGIGILFPVAAGAGQVYNGDLARGIVFSVVQIINAVLLLFFIGLFTYPVFGIWAIYDAYKGKDAPLYGAVLG